MAAPGSHHRPTYRTTNSAHPLTSNRPLGSRSSSSTRLNDMTWTAPTPAPLSLTTGHHNPSEDRLLSDPTYRSSHGWSKDSQTGRVARKVNGQTTPTSSAKAKGKSKALTFVVGAPSSGSGDEGEAEHGSAGDESDDEHSNSHRPRDLGPDEIIRMQIRQPVQTVDSQDLDSLLTHGISDYAYCFRSPDSPKSRPNPPNGASTTEPTRVSLGKGKFSEVVLARKGDVEYALKHTPLHPHHPLIATRLLREPTILAQLLPHPNLVKVFETIRTPGHFYLVEENLRDSITLESLVANSEGGIVSTDIAWSVLKQLSSVVRSLHEPLRVCHRDIKPENILVRVTPSDDPTESPTLLLKLLDFGLATHYSSSEAKLTTCCGSPAYHSPELWRGLREPSGTVKYWGPEVDIWCVGLTLLRCLTPNKYPLGISHSSIFAMSDKVVDALLAVHDEGLRKVLAGLMQMEGEKRMRAFEAFCETMETEEHGKLTPPEMSVQRKEFKSTTFIPTERAHVLELPPLAKASVSFDVEGGIPSRSPSRSRPRHRTNSSIGVDLPTSASSSGPPSPSTPELSPSNKACLSPHETTESLPVTPRNYSHERLHSLPPIELVLLNPTDEPIRRSTSYIKYALRCAGVLYQVREAASDSGFSNIGSPSGDTHPAEDDSSFVCYLQCVIKLPNTDHPSKASSALIAALRPPMARAHTTGAPARSSSTPPLNKRASGQPKKEEVKGLVFFLSIRAAPHERHHHESALAKRRAESHARKGKKKRVGDRIVITFSDERALPIVRDALKIEADSTSPVTTDAEPETRGRRDRVLATDSPVPLPTPGRHTFHSGSREPKIRRSKATEKPSEGLGLSLGPKVVVATPGSGAAEEKKGFFDFASFTKFPGMGSRQNSEAHVTTRVHKAEDPAPPPSATEQERNQQREEAMAGAMGFV